MTVGNQINQSANKATYIKTYKVNFSVQDNDGTTKHSAETTHYYGESVDLEVPSSALVGNKVAAWSSENRNDTDTETESSSKASGRIGSVYTTIVSGNVYVVAELESTSSPSSEDVRRYDICDVYGSLVDVVYSTDVFIGDIATQTITFTEGKEVNAKSVPLYSFDHWQTTQVSENRYKLVPKYSAKPTFDFTFVGASTQGASDIEYDTLVNVSFDTTKGTFAAWATRSNGKYQIASYNANYSFYACEDEEYVAIVNSGTAQNPVYVTADATPVTLTASAIDGTVTDIDTDDEDMLNAILTAKIKNFAPFISIERTVISSDNKQARAYMRITQGAAGNKGYGIIYRSGAATDEQMTLNYSGDTKTYKRIITTMLSTGQFTYTLNSSKGFTKDVSFRGYISYDVPVTVSGNTATLNATDYTAVKTTNKFSV
ncbi:MAG: hypothetical protein E7571_02570 [Ruminococcaceae bacterium]|nr:hypothetical protein [Oscillospiraceae bacterium]